MLWVFKEKGCFRGAGSVLERLRKVSNNYINITIYLYIKFKMQRSGVSARLLPTTFVFSENSQDHSTTCNKSRP